MAHIIAPSVLSADFGNLQRDIELINNSIIDNDSIGVDYPFINGKHYPFVNTVFIITPEGSNIGVQNITVIAPPTTDDCE